MSENGCENTERDTAVVKPSNGIGEPPRSLVIAKNGVRTGTDFANLMSALMSDLIEGKITPGVGNAACNAGGKLLKVVDMQMRYGSRGPGQGKKTLVLTDSVDDQLAPGADGPPAER